MKLSTLLNERNLKVYGFPAFEGLEGKSNMESNISAVLSTLSPAIMANMKVTEYYAPVLPRGAKYATTEEVLAADLDVNIVQVFPGPQFDPEYKITIVSRHPGTIKLLKEEFPRASVMESVTLEQIKDEFVVGTLPPHLIQFCRSYMAVTISDFDHTKDGDLSGQELCKRLTICKPITVKVNEASLRLFIGNVNKLIREIDEKYTVEYFNSVPCYMHHILENTAMALDPTDAVGAIFNSVIDKEAFCLNLCDYIESNATGENVEDRIWLGFTPLTLEVLSGLLTLDKDMVSSIIANQFQLKSAGELSILLVQEIIEFGAVLEEKFNKVGYFLSMEPQRPVNMDETVRKLERYLIELINMYYDDNQRVRQDREKWNVIAMAKEDLVDKLSRTMVNYLNFLGVTNQAPSSDDGMAWISIKDGSGEFRIMISEEPTKLVVQLAGDKEKQVSFPISKEGFMEVYGGMAKSIIDEILSLRSREGKCNSTVSIADKLLRGK